MNRTDRLKQCMKVFDERKEKETKEFLDRVDKVIVHKDSAVYPSVSLVIETDNNYIQYYMAKHGDYQCSIIMHEKQYPFRVYYSKKYLLYELPKKYAKQFDKLKENFNEDKHKWDSTSK